MKALVLAGGTGSRLRPLTHTSPKQLIPVANKPIIDYCLEYIAATDITEVGVIVGKETTTGIQHHLGDGAEWGLKVHYIYQEEPLGLAHCVILSEEFLGDTPFVMCLGDNLFQNGIADTVKAFQGGDADARIMLAEVPDPREFGVAVFDDFGELIRLVEKPADPPSNMIITGLYCFSPAIFEAARSISPSPRGELEITDAIQWLLERGKQVDWSLMQGWWKDTGNPQDILEANRQILDEFSGSIASSAKVDASSIITDQVVLEDGVELEATSIQGPAIIGRGTRLVNATIGPATAISQDCTITNASIEGSIVWEGTRISDIPNMLRGSLIGKNVSITGAGKPIPNTKLVLGDHSQVDFS